MNKKIYGFIIIAIILTTILWMIDSSSTVNINFLQTTSNLTLTKALLLVALFVFIIDTLGSLLRKLFAKQIKEACKFSLSDAKNNEDAAIEDLATRISDKLVINRKDFDEAMLLVLKAMTTITEGDMEQAQKTMKNLKKIVGNDPILDLLQMKIYKGQKDFKKMDKLSAKLMKNEDVQMVGLKAAVESQMQKKDFKDALDSANKAFSLRQDLYWVIESAFELRAKTGDWEGAMQVFNAGVKKKIIPLAKQKKIKAILLFELAKQAKSKGDDTNFFKFATQAFEADKTLAKAAIELANHYKEDDNQIRKAASILTTAWKKNPIDEIAYTYLSLFDDKTNKEKITRMEKFAHYNAKRPSLNNRILAELCAKAGLWKKAKGEIEVFLINNPATKIICQLISLFEEGHNNNKKAAKDWKDKAKKSPHDALWVCNNCEHEHKDWHAVCSNCGTFGEVRWHLYVDEDDEIDIFSDGFSDDDKD